MTLKDISRGSDLNAWIVAAVFLILSFVLIEIKA